MRVVEPGGRDGGGHVTPVFRRSHLLALVLLALDRDDGARAQLVHAVDDWLAFALLALQRAATDVADAGWTT